MTPKNKLSNPYYFIKNDTIFKISSTNESKDSCGKHYVTYMTNPYSAVLKGKTYIDEHGDYVVAEEDLTGVVSTGIVNAEVSAKTFPYFKVSVLIDKENTSYYFWLDDFIANGDVIEKVKNDDEHAPRAITGGTVKFMHSKHSESEEGEAVDFAEDYVNSVKMEIAKSIVEGKTFEVAKRGYPQYLFAAENDEIKIENKTVKVTDITSSFDIKSLPIISEDDLSNSILEMINGSVADYANGILKRVGKKLTNEAIDNMVTDLNTEEL